MDKWIVTYETKEGLFSIPMETEMEGDFWQIAKQAFPHLELVEMDAVSDPIVNRGDGDE